MWALAYVIPRRPRAADVWFAEARALLSTTIHNSRSETKK
jgi:hypothetical protein